MKSKSSTVAIGVALLVVLIIAIRLGGRSTSESSTAAPASEQHTLVEVSPVIVGSMTESIQAVGTLEAIASIMVRPEIAGVIHRIHFQDGQMVERAAPL